jgi:vacuolar-type H+-ATPase subunit F/Vma7
MRWIIIGDELSTLGWRLAGAQPVIATPESVAACFAAATRDADFVLITADLAQHLPEPLLTAALLAEKPLVVVIRALPAGAEPPDLGQQVKQVLGIAV